MLFNSYQFIFAFLPITLVIYFYLNNIKLVKIGKIFLIGSSLFFYSWWNIIYLPLILLSVVFNYFLGKQLSFRLTLKKEILVFGVSINLGLLGYFKYSDFFITNFNLFTNNSLNLLHLALPLAISFYTFQQIAYLVDSYRQETHEYNFLNYMLFVTFFPQLIAGPIVHHKQMMPQFFNIKNKIINYKNIAAGLSIFSVGLFKKVVIADTFSTWANVGFDTASSLNLFAAWATSLSYTFQLYFDFSGYTDMAIGIALLFNIKLPTNFNSPYKAINIQDFWRRWHITLSLFLRDYIYIPLGGNKGKNIRVYMNVLTTFFLAGIWHGAGWLFIFWGLMHGMALVIFKVWKKFNIRLWSVLSWFITFNFINISWVFFRAKNIDDAMKVLTSMFSLDNIILSEKIGKKIAFLHQYNITFGRVTEHLGDGSKVLNWVLIGFILTLTFNNSNEQLKNFQLNYKTAIYYGFIFVITLLELNRVTEFLYYNF